MIYVIKNYNFFEIETFPPKTAYPTHLLPPPITSYLSTQWRTCVRACVSVSCTHVWDVCKEESVSPPTTVMFTSFQKERFNLLHKPAHQLPPAILPLSETIKRNFFSASAARVHIPYARCNVFLPICTSALYKFPSS